MALSSDRQRERLKGLMFVRVLLVTAFLGSALAVDVSTFASLTEARNVSLLALIVLTYLLTIGYAVGLRRQWSTERLAYAQLTGDLVVTTVLTLVTGGFDSLFLFFFHLTILNAAIVVGRKGALIVAGATVACMVYFATVTMGWLPHPILDTDLPHVAPVGLFYEVVINSFAGILIAVLAGYLADRLGEASAELERRKTDIQELRALNENILTSLSSGLLTVDDEGVIIFFNRAAEDITAYSAGQVLGKPLEKLFPGLASAAGEELDAPRSDTRLESTFERNDGSVVYLGFSVSLLRDGKDRPAGRIIIFQDLSEIRKLETQMKRSERLAAIGQLSAAIAHEIRNPLASISGSVEMLSVDEHTSEESQILMNIVVREVERLDTLIRDFLAYSQPRTLSTSPHDIVPIIREVLRLFRSPADRAGIVVDFDCELPSGAVVDIDPEAFRQVVWNLLQNASDAIEELPEDRRRIQLAIEPVAKESDELIFAVEDDGPGVGEEAAERIFEPFFTTKETGTGLGLATIFRLLEEQGCRITLEAPKKLRGARFEVHMPQVDDVAESHFKAEAKTPISA